MKDTMKIIVFVIGLLVVMGLGAFFLLKPGASSNAVLTGGSASGTVQEVRMAVVGYKYVPETLTVHVGQPVRWIVDASQATGCANSLVLSKYDINSVLQGSNNIFEFTPTEKGTLPFSCSMGMVRGQFQVI